MALEIYNTRDKKQDIPVFMLLYGEGGIGKSTFASTAPGVFMADCEGGSKFFGARGIEVTVANIETWFDFAGKGQFVDIALKHPKVETIVIDPIGELMEKCKLGLTGSGLVTSDGQPTMRGWGEIGNRMGKQLRRLRDAGKNVILIAHVDEKEDEGRLVKRPLIQTRLSKTIPNMVDLVGYMHGQQDSDGKMQRVISFDSTDDRIEAKDRTDALSPIMPPSFPMIQEMINEYGQKTKDEKEEDKASKKTKAKAPAKKKAADKKADEEKPLDADLRDENEQAGDGDKNEQEKARQAKLEAARQALAG